MSFSVRIIAPTEKPSSATTQGPPPEIPRSFTQRSSIYGSMGTLARVTHQSRQVFPRCHRNWWTRSEEQRSRIPWPRPSRIRAHPTFHSMTTSPRLHRFLTGISCTTSASNLVGMSTNCIKGRNPCGTLHIFHHVGRLRHKRNFESLDKIAI